MLFQKDRAVWHVPCQPAPHDCGYAFPAGAAGAAAITAVAVTAAFAAAAVADVVTAAAVVPTELQLLVAAITAEGEEVRAVWL
jgi:hypothetical protein